MKIFLGISSGLLLLCLIGIGAFLFLQNINKNTAGSILKDSDLATCVPVDTTALGERVSERIGHFQENPESYISADGQGLALADVLTKEVQDNFDGDTKYCVSEQELITSAYLPLIKVVEVSLGEARRKAQFAALKANASSTAAPVILCIDDGEFVNEPQDDTPICGDGENYGPWPNLTEFGGSWGGCEMTVDRESGTFQYCATTPEGIATCTERGCYISN